MPATCPTRVVGVEEIAILVVGVAHEVAVSAVDHLRSCPSDGPGASAEVLDFIADVMIPTNNSYPLSQHIPGAQLIVCPDSGHGSQFQYPELFLAHARTFLAQ